MLRSNGVVDIWISPGFQVCPKTPMIAGMVRGARTIPRAQRAQALLA
jgi:hypothetical protein